MVNMTMNSEGASEWARITGANIDKRCAIILDGVVYSAPNISKKLPADVHKLPEWQIWKKQNY